MGSLGFGEMVIIFVVALLIFGPKKLPELGKSLGKGIKEFKKATDELKTSWEDQVRDIQAPLNDVKKDVNSIGQDLKDDFYKSIEAESAAATPSEQPVHEPKPADATPHPAESASVPAEASAPKEHA